VLTTGADVIHSFFVPALGIQRYAIPGRTIETWMRADQPGVFYGECNQICGTNHSRMPIVVRAVPEQDFKNWVTQAKAKYASDAAPAAGRTAERQDAQEVPTRLAASEVSTGSAGR
jgi:cytochrome c oxidase subunit 2